MRGSVPLSSEMPYQEQLESKIESLRQQLASRDAEIAALLLKCDSAYVLVAKMHEAAVGMVIGPYHGVVEDVAYVRKERDQLRKKVKMLREALKESRRELDSCQKVIWLASDYGFDPEYVKGAQASIRKTDKALAATKIPE